MNRKYTAVPLSVLVALVAAASAQAQIVGIGDTSQSNDQGITSQQGANQSAGGGIILGGGDQNATNNSTSTANNSQTQAGGLVVGDTDQSSEQAIETTQGVTQDAGGGTLTIAGGDQNAVNNSAGTVNSSQAQIGLIVLGDTGQSNKQGVVTSQKIGQDASAGILILGGDQNATNNSATTDNNDQSVLSALILGDTGQDNTQADCTDQQIDQGADAGTLTLAGGTQNSANNGSTDKGNSQVRAAALVPSRCARVSPPPPPPTVPDTPPAAVPPPVAVVAPPPAVKPVVKKKPKKKVVKKKKKKKKKARKPRRKRGFTG